MTSPVWNEREALLVKGLQQKMESQLLERPEYPLWNLSFIVRQALKTITDFLSWEFNSQTCILRVTGGQLAAMQSLDHGGKGLKAPGKR